MNNNKLHSFLIYFISAIWLINGLICKVLNLVPRHQEIVERILGEEHSRAITIIIGIMEIAMSAWIMTRIKSRLNASIQIAIVLVMNILEYVLVSDILLWGKLNSLFALIFVFLIYYNEWIISPKNN